jgi:hypothetical protein
MTDVAVLAGWAAALALVAVWRWRQESTTA